MTHPIHTRILDGVTYFSTVACDGWPTGPCPSAAKALERVTAYETGEEVSEAAPQQCSRAQMTAWLAWSYDVMPEGCTATRLAEAAFAAGLHSDEWARASAFFIAGWHDWPEHVQRAGGARVRRAPGEISLRRGAAL